jgi:hypothetical protein
VLEIFGQEKDCFFKDTKKGAKPHAYKRLDLGSPFNTGWIHLSDRTGFFSANPINDHDEE